MKTLKKYVGDQILGWRIDLDQLIEISNVASKEFYVGLEETEEFISAMIELGYLANPTGEESPRRK
jgi:hypothetical protein